MRKLTDRHEALFESFLSQREGRPFRRQDLAQMLRPSLRASKAVPHVKDVADQVSDALIAAARSAGKLEKAGHVHWKEACASSRRAKSGRLLERSPSEVKVTVGTHYPSKYALVDLETGGCWGLQAPGTWKRLPDALRAEACQATGGLATTAFARGDIKFLISQAKTRAADGDRDVARTLLELAHRIAQAQQDAKAVAFCQALLEKA